ncbi:hypothetical protein ABK040_009391 [Willaertia magna]
MAKEKKENKNSEEIVDVNEPKLGFSSQFKIFKIFGLFQWLLVLIGWFASACVGSIPIIFYFILASVMDVLAGKDGKIPTNEEMKKDIARIQEAYTVKVGNMIQFLVQCIFGIIMAFTNSWKMSLVMISTSPLIAFLIVTSGKLTQVFTKKTTDATEHSSGIATEVVSSMRTVRSMSGEEFEKNRFFKDLLRMRLFGFLKSLNIGVVMGGLFFCIWGTCALAFWYGGGLVINRELSIGGLMQVFGQMLIAVLGLGQAFAILPDLGKAAVSANVLLKVMNRKPVIGYKSFYLFFQIADRFYKRTFTTSTSILQLEKEESRDLGTNQQQKMDELTSFDPKELTSSELFSIKDKVIVITGGTRGIGMCIAQGYLLNGVKKVYVCSRQKEACEQTEKIFNEYLSKIYKNKTNIPKLIAIQADLSNEEGIDKFCSSIDEDKVHVLVNNSGTNWAESIDNYPSKGWDKVIELNLKTPFFVIQKLLPKLRKAATEDDPARIINIGSIHGKSIPRVETYAYTASKAGLHHLTKHIASRLAQENITCNALACGFFQTKMTKQLFNEMKDEVLDSIPLNRVSKASDIAGTCIFLSSSASSWITGTIIPLDGVIFCNIHLLSSLKQLFAILVIDKRYAPTNKPDLNFLKKTNLQKFVMNNVQQFREAPTLEEDEVLDDSNQSRQSEKLEEDGQLEPCTPRTQITDEGNTPRNVMSFNNPESIIVEEAYLEEIWENQTSAKSSISSNTTEEVLDLEEVDTKPCRSFHHLHCAEKDSTSTAEEITPNIMLSATELFSLTKIQEETTVDLTIIPFEVDVRLIPEEIFTYIFSFVPIRHLYSISVSCKVFHSIVNRDIIWRNIFFYMIKDSKYFLIAKDLIPLRRLLNETSQYFRSFNDNPVLLQPPNNPVLLPSPNNNNDEEKSLGEGLFNDDEQYETFIKRVEENGLILDKKKVTRLRRQLTIGQLDDYLKKCAIFLRMTKDCCCNYQLHVKPKVILHNVPVLQADGNEENTLIPNVNDEVEVQDTVSPGLIAARGDKCDCFYQLCECIVRNRRHKAKIERNTSGSETLQKFAKGYRNFVYPLTTVLFVFLELFLFSAYFEYWQNDPLGKFYLGIVLMPVAIFHSILWGIGLLSCFICDTHEIVMKGARSRTSTIILAFYISLIYIPIYSMSLFMKLSFINTDYVPSILLIGVLLGISCMYTFIVFKGRLITVQTFYEKLIIFQGYCLLLIGGVVSIAASINIDFHVKITGYYSIFVCLPACVFCFVFLNQIFTLFQGISPIGTIRRCCNVMSLSIIISLVVGLPTMAGILLMTLRIDKVMEWNMLYLVAPFCVTAFCILGVIIQYILDR